MKKCIYFLASFIMAFGLLTACGGGTDSQGTANVGNVTNSAQGNVSSSNLGDYNVVIDSCRLAKDYSGKPIVIVKYLFTNNSGEADSFSWSVDDNVYQDGVGLNKSYVVDDSANYSSNNQTKEIKSGVTLAVEVAYELNDTTTDIEVEVTELFSFSSNKKVTKIFTLK